MWNDYLSSFICSFNFFMVALSAFSTSSGLDGSSRSWFLGYSSTQTKLQMDLSLQHLCD